MNREEITPKADEPTKENDELSEEALEEVNGGAIDTFLHIGGHH